MSNFNHTCGVLDIAGVGIGPSNLSVAALAHPLKNLNQLYFEKKPEFDWHEGLIFENSTLQVSFLKDLVTLVDPTSKFSFLSFLSTKKRIYNFINSDFHRVTRKEFNQYLKWVCDSLPTLKFDESVQSISLYKNHALIETKKDKYLAKNVILGTGQIPYVPEFCRKHLGTKVFHASTYLRNSPDTKEMRIAIIGGGQTGAEIIDHLLQDKRTLPNKLYWISGRPNFCPLDESAFTNELFTPSYIKYFYSLPETERKNLLKGQSLASDGISSTLLQSIYRRAYELDFVESDSRCLELIPNHKLTDLQKNTDESYMLTLTRSDGLSLPFKVIADIVILCTGWKSELPECISQLSSRMTKNGVFSVNYDYSVNWDGPENIRFYVQNAARHTHGIADANLSLMAWRAAHILNHLIGEERYDLSGHRSVIDWFRRNNY